MLLCNNYYTYRHKLTLGVYTTMGDIILAKGATISLLLSNAYANRTH